MKDPKFYPYRFLQASRVSKQCITSAMLATFVLLAGFIIEEYRREKKYAEFESCIYRHYEKLPRLETLIDPPHNEEEPSLAASPDTLSSVNWASFQKTS